MLEKGSPCAHIYRTFLSVILYSVLWSAEYSVSHAAEIERNARENGHNYEVVSCFQIVIRSAHINDLAQDCSDSIALALELLHSCAKPSIYYFSSLLHMDIGV